MEAATIAEADDPNAAATLLAEAVSVGIQLDRDAMQAASARLRAVGPGDDARTAFFVAQALGAAASQAGTPDSAELIARAVAIVDAGEVPLTSAQDLFWAGRAYFMLGRNSSATACAQRAVDAAREEGALGVLAQALRLLASASFEAGDWRRAYAAGGDAVAVSTEVGQRATACATYGVLADIDAAAGNEEACRLHARSAIDLAGEIGLGFYRERAERALGHLELALGRLEPAARLLEGVLERLRDVGNLEFNVTPAWDLAETYVRLGRSDEARSAGRRHARGVAASLPARARDRPPVPRTARGRLSAVVRARSGLPRAERRLGDDSVRAGPNRAVLRRASPTAGRSSRGAQTLAICARVVRQTRSRSMVSER